MTKEAELKAEMGEDEKVLAYWVEQAASQKKRADEAERRLAEEWANMDATMEGWDALCAQSLEAEHRFAKVEDAMRELLEACELDCGVPGEDDYDDEPVGARTDGPMALTFGMLRRARAALAPKPKVEERV